MNKKIRSLLYRSFDKNLSSRERQVLENALSQSEDLRGEKESILQLRQAIKKEKVSGFQPFFSERVLNRIQATLQAKGEDSFFNSLLVVFRPLAIAAIILIIIISAYNITSSGQVSLEGALAVPEVTLNDAYATSLAVVIEEE
jgi:hypothetical protein